MGERIWTIAELVAADPRVDDGHGKPVQQLGRVRCVITAVKDLGENGVELSLGKTGYDKKREVFGAIWSNDTRRRDRLRFNISERLGLWCTMDVKVYHGPFSKNSITGNAASLDLTWADGTVEANIEIPRVVYKAPSDMTPIATIRIPRTALTEQPVFAVAWGKEAEDRGRLFPVSPEACEIMKQLGLDGDTSYDVSDIYVRFGFVVAQGTPTFSQNYDSARVVIGGKPSYGSHADGFSTIIGALVGPSWMRKEQWLDPVIMPRCVSCLSPNCGCGVEKEEAVVIRQVAINDDPSRPDSPRPVTLSLTEPHFREAWGVNPRRGDYGIVVPQMLTGEDMLFYAYESLTGGLVVYYARRYVPLT